MWHVAWNEMVGNVLLAEDLPNANYITIGSPVTSVIHNLLPVLLDIN